jgi:hypothetical protein
MGGVKRQVDVDVLRTSGGLQLASRLPAGHLTRAFIRTCIMSEGLHGSLFVPLEERNLPIHRSIIAVLQPARYGYKKRKDRSSRPNLQRLT